MILMINDTKLLEHQAKLNEKYRPVLHCHSSFEGTSYKKLQDTATSSLFHISFYIQQISFFTTFQNLIQNYLKKIFLS